ncbi:hypothetical protein ABTW72_02250 [Micromonospora sp. NPDC127501]|uniref:effector-associated constant component EACC1 n=1 Tax=Micromonospora sp. NPDC127501 TaxID=3154872 RepID=UPI00331B933A
MLRVRILTDGPGELNALYGWLRADAALARTADVRAAPPPPGGMGTLDVVDVVLTHVTAMSSLAVTVLAWRQSRPRPPSITVVRADGHRLTVDHTSQLTAEMISAFLAASDTASGDGPDGGDHPSSP